MPLPLSHKIIAFLRRPRSAGRAYFPEVDGLRFVAIGLVVTEHIFGSWLRAPGMAATRTLTVAGWPEPMQFFVQRGDTGVAIFFVLSAYIISQPFIAAARHGQRLSLRNYYLRRAVRIEPPYLIVTTAIFLMYAATGFGHVRYYAPHYGASMLYLHNIIFPRIYGLNDVAWSLEVEIQFYVVAPLLFLLFRRRKRMRYTALSALAIAAFAMRHWWSPPFISLFQYAGFFISGCLIADVLNRDGSAGKVWQWIVTGAGIMAAVLLFFGCFIPPALTGWVAQVSVPAFVFACLSDTPFRRWLRNVWLATIGGMCYSIYLVHNVALIILFRYGLVWYPAGSSTINFLANVALLSFAVLIAGTVVYKLIEQPFMKQSRRFPLRGVEA